MSAPKPDYKAEALAAFDDTVLEERLIREGEYIRMEFEGALGACESPIEAKLVLALFEHPEFDSMLVRVGASVPYFGCLIDELELCPQFVIGSYRCDFAFRQSHPNGTQTRIIVECDGHDFHERTKEQAQRDKSRDRYLQANGWKVLRFTGSEIHRTPEKCAAEIASIIQDDMISDWRLVS